MRFFIFILSLAMVSLVQPVSAQRETGSRIGPEIGQISDNPNSAIAARRSMDDYARCVVGAVPASVEKFLAQFPGDPTYVKLANSVAPDECLSTGELRFKAVNLRTALYDRYYREKFKVLAFKTVSDVVLTDAFANVTSDEAKQHANVIYFANCVVAADPAAAHNLISSAIATTSEANAFSAIQPYLGPCLSKDASVKFSKSILRGFIAESLYRISVAARIMTKNVKQ